MAPDGSISTEHGWSDGVTEEDRGFVGMSREEILSNFYGSVEFARDGDAWKCNFIPDSYKGRKLVADLVNAETGEVSASAGTKLTPRA